MIGLSHSGGEVCEIAALIGSGRRLPLRAAQASSSSLTCKGDFANHQIEANQVIVLNQGNGATPRAASGQQCMPIAP